MNRTTERVEPTVDRVEPTVDGVRVGPRAERPRRFGQTCRASRECSTATRLKSIRCEFVSGALMRRRADRAALRGIAAGLAADGQPRLLPAKSTDVRSVARNAIAMDGLLRYAATARGRSTPGWCAKGGRWRTAGTRERTSRRSWRRKRRGADSGAENSSGLGTGAEANACRPPTGTTSASHPATAAPATSRETSAATAGGAYTTFPGTRTMLVPVSVPQRASVGSAPNPRRVPQVGGDMAGNSRGGGGSRRDYGSSVPRAGTDWRERFTTIDCLSGIVPGSSHDSSHA